jgi:CDP-L-myo-inositol myo-inositolphosphotransferase
LTVHAIDAERARKPVRTLFGWLVYRRISMPLSLRVARTRLLPWHITATGLALGLSGAVLLSTGRYELALAGAVLVNVAKVMDAMDGEVARVKRLDSAAGYVADGLCDRLRDTAVIAGLGIGAAQDGGDAALAWTLAAVIGYLLFFYVSAATPSHWREIRRTGDVDEKHAFRVTPGVRLGAGDTLAMGVLIAAAIDRPLWLVAAIAILAPFAIAVKVRRLFAQRPWERESPEGDPG